MSFVLFLAENRCKNCLKLSKIAKISSLWNLNFNYFPALKDFKPIRKFFFNFLSFSYQICLRFVEVRLIINTALVSLFSLVTYTSSPTLSGDLNFNYFSHKCSCKFFWSKFFFSNFFLTPKS